MITRVTDQMRYEMLNNSIFHTQGKYSELMEKLATQKQVNKPSDDPLGMGKILDYRSAKAYISNYQENITSSQSWLSATESSLSNINDILTKVKETAVSQATATATASTRQIAADALEPLIEQIRSKANTKFGNRYLFSGTMTDTEPFSASASVARIDGPVAASNNAFDGTVASGGAYTGTANKTYVVKIITGGPLATATYQISADGGRTWGAAQTDLSAPVAIGDGIQLTFTAGTVDVATNDVFTVNGYASGYYSGNGEELSSEVGKDVVMNYGVTGEAVFTDQGQGVVNLFQVLNDLKTALENNDAEGIRDQLNPLDDAMHQINRYTAQCGTRTNGLDVSKSALSDLDLQLTSLTSDIEDADITALITAFKMKEIALQATYQMAGKIGNISIIDFIK
jgi:flagellar hook-associated protein 3